MATMDETRSCWGDRLVVSVFLYKELCKENDSSQIFQGSRHFRLEFGTRVAKVMADASPVSMSNFDSPVEGCTQVQHDLQCTLLAGCVMRLPLPVLKENHLWEAPLKEGMRHLVTVLPDRFEGVGFDRLFDPGVRYLFTVGFPRVIAAVGFSHALRLSWYTSEETERKLTMDNLMKIDVLHESSVPSPDKGPCRQSSNGHDELERSPPGPVQRALGQSRSQPLRRALPSSLHIHGNFPHQEREV